MRLVVKSAVVLVKLDDRERVAASDKAACLGGIVGKDPCWVERKGEPAKQQRKGVRGVCSSKSFIQLKAWLAYLLRDQRRSM